MEAWSANWEAKRLAGEPVIPVVVLVTPLGERVYSSVSLGDTFADFGSAFDADAAFDAALPFNAGGLMLESASARLVRLGELEESSITIESDVLPSTGARRLSTDFELDNADGSMGTIVGGEYLLNQIVRIYLTFAGLDVADALLKVTGIITGYTLTSRALRIAVEAR